MKTVPSFPVVLTRLYRGPPVKKSDWKISSNAWNTDGVEQVMSMQEMTTNILVSAICWSLASPLLKLVCWRQDMAVLSRTTVMNVAMAMVRKVPTGIITLGMAW